jgi:hypothetical protein
MGSFVPSGRVEKILLSVGAEVTVNPTTSDVGEGIDSDEKYTDKGENDQDSYDVSPVHSASRIGGGSRENVVQSNEILKCQMTSGND